jgi:hypothetical protein
MQGVMTDEMEMWQRISRFAGWSEWEIGPEKQGEGFKNSFDNKFSNKFENKF